MPNHELQKRASSSSRAKRGICFFFALALLTAAHSVAAQTSPRPKITRIDHVVFYSSDLKSASDFYGTKLALNVGGSGCRETLRTCFTVNWASRQHIELEPSNHCSSGNCLKEIVFETGNARKLRSYLMAKGFKVDPISKARDLSLLFGLQDPEGHRIAFVQFPLIGIDDLPPGVRVGPSFLHAGFIVHDRERMERFYKDILGFRSYWHGGMKDDETNWVSLQVPDGSDWIEFMLNIPDNADKRLRGIMNHIALGVGDIHAAQEQLRKNGAPLTEESKIGRDGKWQLNLYDPDGTRVEFMEFTPVQKPCCSEFTAPHPKP